MASWIFLAAASRVRADVLLCHADDDPFVSDADVHACTAQLRGLGARVGCGRGGARVTGATRLAPAAILRHGLGQQRRLAARPPAAQ